MSDITESYSYDSTLVRNYLTNPKLKGTNATSFLNLLKILEKDEDKEGAPVEHYDFAGNLPLIITYLFEIKTKNPEISKELIKLLQVGLSDLTKKCRELQKELSDHANEKITNAIASLIVDTSQLIIDNNNANGNTSLSTEKSDVTIAHDKKKNYYAIKRFKRNIESADKQKSFLHNILSYSKLSHYSILPFVGVNLYYKSDSRYCCPSVITQYEKKKSLFDLLFKTTDRFYLSDTQKMIVLLGIATALKTLHKQGITHRNLKPSNVLINSKYEPFVSDFFNSHLDSKDPTSVAFIAPEILIYEEQKTAATKTVNLTKSGSKRSQTPETNKPKESKYTKEADVYSFGMIAYSVLSSQAPFSTESLQPQNVVKIINNGTRPTIPSYIPSNFAGLVEYCWNGDPSKRPSFKEIVDFLTETKPLPETDLQEYSNYMNKVRPKRNLSSIIQQTENSEAGAEKSEKMKTGILESMLKSVKNTRSKNLSTKSARNADSGNKSSENKTTGNSDTANQSARSTSSANKNTRNTNSGLSNPAFEDETSESEIISELENINDPEEAYQLAIKWRPKSIPRSNIYLKRSAELGHTKGQIEYGKYLLDEFDEEFGNSTDLSISNNKGETPLKLNEVWAAHYFKLAASHDEPEALYLYGRCLYYGIGVAHNYSKAAKYLEKAASKGDKDGQYLYGLCLKEGNGVPQNIPLAIRYFKKAELNGVVSARRQLNQLGTEF